MPTDSQTFILPDGRQLGYAEYGPSNGRPLIYLHGYPSSRIEAEPLTAAAHEKDIRIISLERPGFGISSPQPSRRISDYPQDVHDFAVGMGLSRFAVMGLSGGGPYALACATRSAPTRGMISSVGLFASAPPWAAGEAKMERYRRWLAVLSRRCPTLLSWMLMGVVKLVKEVMSLGFVQRYVDNLLATVREKAGGTKESTAEDNVKRRENLMRLMIEEPFRQGARAAVDEARLLSAHDWSFKFAEVDFEPVRIWHGTKDANSPIENMRWLAQRVPRAVLTEFETDTHYTMFPRISAAMEELVSAKDKETQ